MINKGENLNIWFLQAFNLAPEMGGSRSATRFSIAVATRQVGK